MNDTISKSMATATPLISSVTSDSQVESRVQNTIPNLIDKYEKARLEEAMLEEARRSQSQSGTPNSQMTAGSSIQFPARVEWLQALVGSKYEKREIVGDGNCFLHAMSQIIIEQARGSNEERKDAVKQFFVDNTNIQNILNSINDSNSNDKDLQNKLTPIIRKKLIDYLEQNADTLDMTTFQYSYQTRLSDLIKYFLDPDMTLSEKSHLEVLYRGDLRNINNMTTEQKKQKEAGYQNQLEDFNNSDAFDQDSMVFTTYLSELRNNGEWLGLETLPFVRNIFKDILFQNDLGGLFLGKNGRVSFEGLTADNLPPYVLENTTGTHWTIYVKTPNAA